MADSQAVIQKTPLLSQKSSYVSKSSCCSKYCMMVFAAIFLLSEVGLVIYILVAVYQLNVDNSLDYVGNIAGQNLGAVRFMILFFSLFLVAVAVLLLYLNIRRYRNLNKLRRTSSTTFLGENDHLGLPGENIDSVVANFFEKQNGYNKWICCSEWGYVFSVMLAVVVFLLSLAIGCAYWGATLACSTATQNNFYQAACSDNQTLSAGVTQGCAYVNSTCDMAQSRCGVLESNSFFKDACVNPEKALTQLTNMCYLASDTCQNEAASCTSAEHLLDPSTPFCQGDMATFCNSTLKFCKDADMACNMIGSESSFKEICRSPSAFMNLTVKPICEQMEGACQQANDACNAIGDSDMFHDLCEDPRQPPLAKVSDLCNALEGFCLLEGRQADPKSMVICSGVLLFVHILSSTIMTKPDVAYINTVAEELKNAVNDFTSKREPQGSGPLQTSSAPTDYLSRRRYRGLLTSGRWKAV